MRRAPVHVVGIAGPSGAGKSSLAAALAAGVPGGGVCFALDMYYRDQRHVPDRQIEVDSPDALDRDLIVAHVRALREGRAVEQPVYDYATHARADERQRFEPAPTLIVDGLFSLYWDDLRALVDTAVFVSLDHAECLRRRIERDMRERGRDAESVARHYTRSVQPMYERYVEPTRHHAHLVLDGREPVERLLARALEALAER